LGLDPRTRPEASCLRPCLYLLCHWFWLDVGCFSLERWLGVIAQGAHDLIEAVRLLAEGVPQAREHRPAHAVGRFRLRESLDPGVEGEPLRHLPPRPREDLDRFCVLGLGVEDLSLDLLDPLLAVQ